MAGRKKRAAEAEDAQRAYQREYHRAIRAEAVANGYCSLCTVEKASSGYAMCEKCRERERIRSAQRRAAVRHKRLCSRCRVRRWTKGYSTCAPCRKSAGAVR